MQRKSLAPFFVACAIAAGAPLVPAPQAPAVSGFPGWPAEFDGRTLQRLPLSPLEARFADNFPGRIGRFSDGEREVILRWVAHDTRRLHPAADCFKASGYALTHQPMEVDAHGVRWTHFLARRGETTVSVRERMYDADGRSFSDVSAWYWAAFWGRSRGPWWAVTVARRAP
ncbi:MAG TPA: hypothetical protein VKE95_04545 [Burkholderiales bacterium]|nr:hypothetical protein [Burkholderiales bacterium]